jgi:hypothetical protein
MKYKDTLKEQFGSVSYTQKQRNMLQKLDLNFKPVCKRRSFYYASYSFLLFFVVAMIKNAFADQPFIIDSPEPTAYRHYELYLYSTLDKNNVAVEEPQLNSPAMEFNLGVLRNLHVHISVPFAWSLPPAANSANGIGDIEVGAKYRFIQETNTQPQVAIYPVVELPSGSAVENLGNGKMWMKVPIWFQKNWGKWKMTGGAGYALNSAIYQQVQMRNFPYGGWILQKEIGERLIFGGELYSQGAVSKVLSRPFTILSFGGYYNFSKDFSLLFSVGNSVLGEQHLHSYLGLYWTGAT